MNDYTEFFQTSPHVAKVQSGTVAGLPALFLTPAGINPLKNGDKAQQLTYHVAENRLVWRAGKGSMSDACWGHLDALCDEAKALGITVER